MQVVAAIEAIDIAGGVGLLAFGGGWEGAVLFPGLPALEGGGGMPVPLAMGGLGMPVPIAIGGAGLPVPNGIGGIVGITVTGCGGDVVPARSFGPTC